MVSRGNTWFWDGPVVAVRVSCGATSAEGHVFNVWPGGIGVRVHTPAPAGLQRGDLVQLEVELPDQRGTISVPGTLRQRGTGCHDGFLSIALSEEFTPLACTQNGISRALEALDAVSLPASE